MRVIVTGGAGFVGTLLARRLLAGPVEIDGGEQAGLDELVLADLAAPAPDLAADPRVRAATVDLATEAGDLGPADVIFHLAGVVSGAAEADFDLGLRTNLDGTRAVLEHARRQDAPPVLVFSSSVAVFGPQDAPGAAGVVGDETLPQPQSSYGIQKFIAEQLVADYTRKGFIRGRSVRLMTVAVRPGRPNAAASSFVSGIIREPLAGLRAPCPVPPDTPVALASPARALEGILRAAAVADAAWGSRTAMTLPGLTTTPRDMAAAMDRVAGHAASDLIDWTDDPAIAAIVGSWPARVEARRAHALGLRPDSSFDDIVRDYRQGQADSERLLSLLPLTRWELCGCSWSAGRGRRARMSSGDCWSGDTTSRSSIAGRTSRPGCQRSSTSTGIRTFASRSTRPCKSARSTWSWRCTGGCGTSRPRSPGDARGSSASAGYRSTRGTSRLPGRFRFRCQRSIRSCGPLARTRAPGSPGCSPMPRTRCSPGIRGRQSCGSRCSTGRATRGRMSGRCCGGSATGDG